MSDIKACVFDLDGTLTNTIYAIAHFGNMALNAYGMESIDVEDYKMYVGDGRDKLIHRILNARSNDTPEMFKKVCRVYDDNYEKDYLYDTDAYDGVRELLSELRDRGIKLAVCTNKPSNVAHFVIESIFGADCFDAISGALDGNPVKPDPYPALKAASALGVKSEECLFIGDTNVDILTAKNASMISVGVLWGFRSRTELVRAGADYIISEPHALLQLVPDKKQPSRDTK